MNKYAIRVANQDDVQAMFNIRKLAIENAQATNADIVNLDQAFDWSHRDTLSRIEFFVSDNARIAEIAYEVDSEEIVGFCIVKQNEIERIFVTPTHQCNKVGTMLVENAASQIITKFPSIKVDSFVTSRKFYEALGFIPISTSLFELDHSSIYTYWMIRMSDKKELIPKGGFSELKDVRVHIDKCDRTILEALMERFALVEWVGEHKAANNISTYDGDRERAQAKKLTELANTYAISPDLVNVLFGIIRDASRSNHDQIKDSQHFVEK